MQWPGFLENGFNILAVELHQAAGAGRLDGGFNLELLGNIGYQSPQIILTQPADGSGFTTNSILIEANASDPDGHITHVDYYVDDVQVGSATEEPYSFYATVTAGAHAIYGLPSSYLSGLPARHPSGRRKASRRAASCHCR